MNSFLTAPGPPCYLKTILAAKPSHCTASQLAMSNDRAGPLLNPKSTKNSTRKKATAKRPHTERRSRRLNSVHTQFHELDTTIFVILLERASHFHKSPSFACVEVQTVKHPNFMVCVGWMVTSRCGTLIHIFVQRSICWH